MGFVRWRVLQTDVAMRLQQPDRHITQDADIERFIARPSLLPHDLRMPMRVALHARLRGKLLKIFEIVVFRLRPMTVARTRGIERQPAQ